MLWMITDFSKSKNLFEAQEQIERVLKSGTDKVSLRNNGDLTQMQALDLAAELSQKYPDKEIFLHNPDKEAVQKYDKFHFSERFLIEAVELKAQNNQIIAAISLHSGDMIEKVFNDGMNYAFYSPVYPPLSKPDDHRKTVDPIDMKNLYLLGGINRMRGRSLIEKGFTNLAGISLFYGDTAEKDISELSELIKEKCK